MITVLIGHRGVGKSKLLEHIAQTTSLRVIDLDQAIEEARGQSIVSLFTSGEAEFRRVETMVFQKLLGELDSPTVIALGAGFRGEIPEGVRVVWVRRSTDRDGRVFLNRPRLTKMESPLDEYLSLFAERESRYDSMATEVLQIPEGYTGGLERFFAPEDLSSEKFLSAPADLTLYPKHLNLDFIKRRIAWGIRYFELRSDLLSQEQMQWGFANIPAENILYSIRSSEYLRPPMGVKTDWPLEMGPPPFDSDILSCHESETNFIEPKSSSQILKLAIEVNSFAELLKGHHWWLQDSKRRAFLPRSKNGRWQWYRSIYGAQMPIHFVREDEGSALDQPYLWQSVLQPETSLTKMRQLPFAAVLGAPVHHSRTPMEHLQFFKERGVPVVAIDMSEEEWTAAMPILEELGLKFAAVTAPLKKLAGGNTLAWSKEQWVVTNTDVDGLRALKAQVSENQTVAMWGGGGTIESVQAVFPDVKLIPARQGAIGISSPDVLLWAVGRNRDFQWPPADWRLQKVLDLNYTENSPGLELASQLKIDYVSGLEMFRVQAAAQREFWRRFL